jgi:bifunctional non-homologous end joining protein LigD
MGDRAVRLQYILFDLPYFNGYDLRQCPLLERKAILRQVLADAGESDVVRYGDHIQGDGAHVFEQVRRMRLEGVVSKLASSPYVSARTRSWLKIKAMLGQEFVVIGFTDPQGSRIGFGALLLGYYEGPDLVFCGRVGTGFSDSELRSLSDSLKKLEVRETPAARGPLEEEKGSHWVQPQIVCQVAFAEWTDDGHLRHPSFEGLRLDKAPREVVRDTPV